MSSQPKPGQVDEFHDWYDHEHVPARERLAGFHSAERLRALDHDEPEWLALYRLELDALRRPDYRRLRAERSDREQRVMADLEHIERQVYRVVQEYGEPGSAPLRVINRFQLSDEAIPDLLDWYREEHGPGLRGVPGWGNIAVGRLVDGAGAPIVAIHGVWDRAAFDTAEYRRLSSSAWRNRIVGRVAFRERREYELYRRSAT